MSWCIRALQFLGSCVYIRRNLVQESVERHQDSTVEWTQTRPLVGSNTVSGLDPTHWNVGKKANPISSWPSLQSQHWIVIIIIRALSFWSEPAILKHHVRTWNYVRARWALGQARAELRFSKPEIIAKLFLIIPWPDLLCVKWVNWAWTVVGPWGLACGLPYGPFWLIIKKKKKRGKWKGYLQFYNSPCRQNERFSDFCL